MAAAAAAAELGAADFLLSDRSGGTPVSTGFRGASRALMERLPPRSQCQFATAEYPKPEVIPLQGSSDRVVHRAKRFLSHVCDQ